MAISQVALSNTFNEFRTTFNDAANTVNSLIPSANAISANTITLASLTSGRVPLVSTAGLIVDDSNLTYNTSTDVLTLGGSTDASSTTTGTLIVTGGVGVAKKLYVGTDLNVAGNTVSSTVTANNLTSGRVVLSGTAGQILDDSALTYNTSTDILTLAGTTDATTSTDGTLVVSGGVGVAKKLYVGTDLNVAGNATFTGNVTILGSNSEISTTQINVNDSLLQLANNNTSNTVDIGVFGQYNSGSGNVHSGLFRDASDGTWKFFKEYNIEPGTTIDPAANGFSYANVSIGSLTANGAIIAPQASSIIPFHYDNQAAFPSAATYHGAIAHSHADGAMFMAHAGYWVRMLDTGGPLGTPSSGTLSNCTVDGTNGVGYLNIPQNSQSTAYTTVLGDAGKSIFHPSTDANARTFTIAANASVAYPIGTVIQFVNMTSQVVTIAINSDTMYLGGTGTTGSRSLAIYGVANAMKMTSTTWIITGSGLT